MKKTYLRVSIRMLINVFQEKAICFPEPMSLQQNAIFDVWRLRCQYLDYSPASDGVDAVFYHCGSGSERVDIKCFGFTFDSFWSG